MEGRKFFKTRIHVYPGVKIILIIIRYSFRVFHISVNWWFYTEFERQQASSSLQDSSQYSGRFQFGWSPLVLLLPSPPVPVPILWWPHRASQILLASPSLSCSTVFSLHLQGLSIYLSLPILSVLFCGQPKRQSPLFGRLSLIFYYYFIVIIVLLFLLFLFYYYCYYSFSHQLTLMVIHWSLSDSKSPQVSRTLLSILAVLNNALIWMVSTRPPTAMSSSHRTKCTNYNWYNCHLHVPQFFQFLNKVAILIFLFTFLQIYSVVRRDSNVDYFSNSLFFFLDYYMVWSSGRD